MRTRIISAIVVLAILIPLIILGGIPFAIGVGIIGLLGYKELVNLKIGEDNLPLPVKLSGMVALLLLIYSAFDGNLISFGLSYRYLGAAFLLVILPTVFYGKEGRYKAKDAFYLFGFITILGLFFNLLILIVDYNVMYLVFLVLITTMTDTFAMSFGSLIGKNKITTISPNKTLEGCVMGSILGTFIATIFYINIINADVNLFKLIIIVLSLTVIGQLSDLLFSKIKRENNIKDFSNIMPGHGGVLDRLDSLIGVVLAFAIIFTII